MKIPFFPTISTKHTNDDMEIEQTQQQYISMQVVCLIVKFVFSIVFNYA